MQVIPRSTHNRNVQFNTSSQKPHPRIFVSLCGVTILIILFFYSVLILYPSYQTGIYRSEDPSQEIFAVPFYTYDTPGIRDDTAPIWAISPFVEIFAIFFFPPLSIALLIVLIKQWRRFTTSEQFFWTSTLMVTWIAFTITFPAAINFGVWLAD